MTREAKSEGSMESHAGLGELQGELDMRLAADAWWEPTGSQKHKVHCIGMILKLTCKNI